MKASHTLTRIALFVLLPGILLAGCNFATSNNPKPQPTVGSPVAWATAQTQNAATLPPSPTSPVQPGGAAPTQTAPAQATNNAPAVTILPPASFTPSGLNPVNTPVFTPTGAALGIITLTPAPTLTAAPVIQSAATAVPTATWVPGVVQPPTFTPVVVQQTLVSSPTPLPPSAQVCPTCGALRLRDGPGTAGNVIASLDANTPLTVIGRTADNTWVQVITPDGKTGWVAAQYVVLGLDLNAASITGVVANAPTAPAPQPVTDVGADGLAIVSGVSAHARQIFLNGVAKGNRPGVFSKVGDSITFAPFFLHHLAYNYNLGQYTYLKPALTFFYGPNARGENPFSAASLAAKPGWSTVSLLTPGLSDSPLCRGDETPLVCEYRTARPSVALIMLGTIDSEGFITLDQYRANLERIVQITIDMGIIPVLSTIPPLQVEAERNARGIAINQVIIAVARAYDIPLWNYYGAMINLPNKGLSGDGGHPSEPPDGLYAYFDANHLQYGYPVRNLTALQMLYELWRQVLYDNGQGQVVVAPDTSSAPVGQSADPATYSCPGTLPLNLQVGQNGRVTPGLPNKVRTAPAMSAAAIGSIPGEGVFKVVGGPKCADGYTWWQVDYNGLVGWTASGTASEYWVEAAP